MAVSTQLFELIKTLSSSEKRYFRLFCGLQGGEKNYLLLFDYIAEQKEYDEDVLKDYFSEYTFSRSLHVTKNYLYNLVMRSLRSFYAQVHVEQKIGDLIADTLLLEDRGLYDQASQALGKAKKIATKYHCHHYLPFLLRKEADYQLALNEKKLKENLAKITREWLTTSELMNAERKAFCYYFEVGYLQRNRSVSLAEKEEFREHFIKEKKPTGRSFYTYYLNESTRAALATFAGDNQRRFECNQRIVQHWKDHPRFLKIKPHTYKIQLANLLNAAFKVDAYDEFPEIIKEMEAIPSRNFNEAAETFQNVSFYKLLYYLNTQKLDTALDSLTTITNGFNKYESKINKARELAFYYNISVLYFMLSDFDRSLLWLNKITNHSKTDHRKDLQRFVQILQICYHISLGNSMLVESQLIAVRKKLIRWSPLTTFENITLENLRRLSIVVDKVDQQKVLQGFAQNLVEFEIKQQQQEKPLPLGFEEMKLWIKQIGNSLSPPK